MNRILFEIYEILETLLSAIPGTPGVYLRRSLYNIVLKRSGCRFNTGLRVRIQVPGNVVIGDNVRLNYGVWVAANHNKDGGVIMGNDVLIGPYTVVHSGNHKFRDCSVPINKQGFNFKTINIEDDVWIASHCTILSGVTIGKGSVVAAGSVVTKDIPPYAVVAGVPAKVISMRD